MNYILLFHISVKLQGILDALKLGQSSKTHFDEKAHRYFSRCVGRDLPDTYNFYQV